MDSNSISSRQRNRNRKRNRNRNNNSNNIRGLHYIVSEGVPIEERVDQADQRYGVAAMRSRPLQTAYHQENPTLCSTTSGASMPIVVWKPWEELGAKLIQFRWLVELARSAWKSWTRDCKASRRRSKPTMAWKNEDIQRAVLFIMLVGSQVAFVTRISKKSQVTSNHVY